MHTTHASFHPFLEANLPGARTERALHKSFYRQLPELLRFSSAARLLDLIPETVQVSSCPNPNKFSSFRTHTHAHARV